MVGIGAILTKLVLVEMVLLTFCVSRPKVRVKIFFANGLFVELDITIVARIILVYEKPIVFRLTSSTGHEVVVFQEVVNAYTKRMLGTVSGRRDLRLR